jgi:hypothetical protein
MSNSLKGALLSGLILPGLGQVFLKHYIRGAALILAALVCLSSMVVKTMENALAIHEKLGLKGGAISMSDISKAAAQASSTSDSLNFNFLALLLMLCWIIGVVDAYRIGKKMDMAGASTAQSSNSDNH